MPSASPERLARYLWATEVAGGGRVLDAACGSGWGTVELTRNAAAVGVDISPAAIGAARETFGELADFREGDLRNLPFDDAEFDCAVCFEALDHLEKPEQAIAELHRVLRPGGALLVSTVDPEAYPAGNPLHLSEVGPPGLEEMLDARFEHVAMYPQRACFASALGDPHGAEVVGDSAGPELYAVAAASDGELPAPPAVVALGEDIDYEELWRSLCKWQERAVRAEAELLALQRQRSEPGA
jgi:SAM-dependent methyltransferase